jgi:hypothetical protein
MSLRIRFARIASQHPGELRGATADRLRALLVAAASPMSDDPYQADRAGRAPGPGLGSVSREVSAV